MDFVMHVPELKRYKNQINVLCRNAQKDLTLLGVTAPLRLHPHRVGIPHEAISLRGLIKNLKIVGVKGALPLGCLPLWGREGVTLLYTEEDWQVTGKRGFLQSRLMKISVPEGC